MTTPCDNTGHNHNEEAVSDLLSAVAALTGCSRQRVAIELWQETNRSRNTDDFLSNARDLIDIVWQSRHEAPPEVAEAARGLNRSIEAWHAPKRT
jgi:hypothetical protein